jgi:dCMP deaminase
VREPRVFAMRRDKAIKYFKLAEFQANLFSKDPSTKVGTLLLRPDSLQVLSQGYNGFPRGIDEKDPSRWERPAKYARVIHAELNGICNACRHGTPLENAIAVVTLFPCQDCAKALIQVGVSLLVTREPDFEDPRWGNDFRMALEMFEEAGVRVMTLTPEELL